MSLSDAGGSAADWTENWCGAQRTAAVPIGGRYFVERAALGRGRTGPAVGLRQAAQAVDATSLAGGCG